MRTLVILLGLCGVAAADDNFDRLKMDDTIRKLSSRSSSLGTIPVKYHEQFGPYKLWIMTDQGGFSNFQARFVTIKNGTYVFGVDAAPTVGAIPVKQMHLFAVPMKRFNLQTQEEFRKEFQKRQRDLKEKRVTYPEPPPEVKEDTKAIAQQPVKRKSYTIVREIDPVTGKMKNVQKETTEADRKAVPPQQNPTAIPPGVKVK